MARQTEGPLETTEVRDVHRFDEAALQRYMEKHVAGFRGPLTVRQFQGGQSNPTYYLATPDHEYVLRRKPPGKLLPSAHAVDREYRVITALGHTDVPVPRTYALCLDDGVIGTAFYIMDCMRGRIFPDPLLPGMTPRERSALYDDINAVLARLHRVDWNALGLADFGKPGNYFARQIHRWTSQYRASETEHIDAMERLIAWLPANLSVVDETALVHGDYRPGNMIMHPTEPRVVALLDWELSTLGHPLADLAYNCLLYHVDPGGLLGGVSGEDLAALGIPREKDYLAAYCRRTGRAGIGDWDFCIAFALFRLAAIAQGIMGRVIAGTANDPHARERGARARPLAEAAWAVATGRASG
jgi:aminoglycoside phosphotransferase (APT) family kinase protein